MSTLDELRKVISKITHCDEREINLDTSLKDVKADSLNWVQIIIGAEMAFDIEIDIDRMKELTTIQDFVNYMDSCIK
jgi:acyl carrier protein